MNTKKLIGGGIEEKDYLAPVIVVMEYDAEGQLCQSTVIDDNESFEIEDWI